MLLDRAFRDCRGSFVGYAAAFPGLCPDDEVVLRDLPGGVDNEFIAYPLEFVFVLLPDLLEVWTFPEKVVSRLAGSLAP